MKAQRTRAVRLRRVFGTSVTGATHLRDQRGNQDAIRWYPATGRATKMVVALSDGHGSATCFRSELGSRLAVDAAIVLGRKFLAASSGCSAADLEDRARTQLTTAVVDRWTAEVQQSIRQSPFLEAELEIVEQREGLSARRTVESEPLLAYGATLLWAIIAESGVVLLQLGDGDMLAVTTEGAPSRPLPLDARLFGNETTSLCMVDAWREFRVTSQAISPAGPAVLLLATDGLGNAYPDEPAFLKVGADLLARVRSDGLQSVEMGLESWLQEASRHSGDDATAAVVWMGA